jgi:hypothetical protein
MGSHPLPPSRVTEEIGSPGRRRILIRLQGSSAGAYPLSYVSVDVALRQSAKTSKFGDFFRDPQPSDP